MTQPIPAYERNREPILQVLKQIFTKETRRVFEVGSGSGHHAIFFASHFPWLQWVPSERTLQLPDLQETLKAAAVPNVAMPVVFEVDLTRAPIDSSFDFAFDAVFSANVLHIMSVAKGERLIHYLGEQLMPGTDVLFYGPFNYHGEFTSDSNANFDRWLKSVDPERGIRNFEDISALMAEGGFNLQRDFEMPANNRLLHFKKPVHA